MTKFYFTESQVSSRPIFPFLYNVFNVKPQLYAKGLVWSRGGGGGGGGGGSTSVNLFLFPIF